MIFPSFIVRVITLHYPFHLRFLTLPRIVVTTEARDVNFLSCLIWKNGVGINDLKGNFIADFRELDEEGTLNRIEIFLESLGAKKIQEGKKLHKYG